MKEELNPQRTVLIVLGVCFLGLVHYLGYSIDARTRKEIKESLNNLDCSKILDINVFYGGKDIQIDDFCSVIQSLKKTNYARPNHPSSSLYGTLEIVHENGNLLLFLRKLDNDLFVSLEEGDHLITSNELDLKLNELIKRGRWKR